MDKKIIREKLESGYIQVRAVMELIGKPKEHIQSTADLIVKSIKENDYYVFLDSNIDEIIEKDGIFFTIIEVELLFKDAGLLFGFCIDFMPASIEIIEPDNLHMSHNILTGLLNDLLVKLHTISERLRAIDPLVSENQMLQKKVKVLIENLIILSIKENARTVEEIAANIGILPRDLGGFIDDLKKSGIIEEGDDKTLSLIGKLKKLKVVKKGKNGKEKESKE